MTRLTLQSVNLPAQQGTHWLPSLHSTAPITINDAAPKQRSLLRAFSRSLPYAAMLTALNRTLGLVLGGRNEVLCRSCSTL